MMRAKLYDFTVRTMAGLCEAVERFGFVPLFACGVAGFSLEEHCAPEAWFPDEGEGVWEWKGPVIRATGCAYGKFIGKKAAFVSREWFADLANCRRDGYDFDARCNDGLVPFADKELYDLIAANAPVLSKRLKFLAGCGRGGRKGFDTSMTRLQAQCYVLISDFVYEIDKNGRPYGWGVAEYSTPEAAMGGEFTDNVYRRTPQESRERVLDHLRGLFPRAGEAALRNLVG